MKNLIRKILKEEFNREFYDNPRRVVKTHYDYNRLIGLLSQIDDSEEIKNIIEGWILENEPYFAELIFCRKYEEYVYCEHAAEMVAQILEDSGKEYKTQVGVIDKEAHAWVRYKDVIIDPTKDQFPNIEYKDYPEYTEYDTYYEKPY